MSENKMTRTRINKCLSPNKKVLIGCLVVIVFCKVVFMFNNGLPASKAFTSKSTKTTTTIREFFMVWWGTRIFCVKMSWYGDAVLHEWSLTLWTRAISMRYDLDLGICVEQNITCLIGLPFLSPSKNPTYSTFIV